MRAGALRQSNCVNVSGNRAFSETVSVLLLAAGQFHGFSLLSCGVRSSVNFFEFRMHRAELFRNANGGLVAVHPDDNEYATFMTHGMDDFESPAQLDGQGIILKRCRGCHSDSGIHSVQSRHQWMNRSEAERQLGNGEISGDAVTWEINVTIAHKRLQSEFSLLHGLWLAERD
jgi:hypothetical protein